jgi:hypothetical protein
LTEVQIIALEKAKADKEAHSEFESECPGYCGRIADMCSLLIAAIVRLLDVSSQRSLSATASTSGRSGRFSRVKRGRASELAEARAYPMASTVVTEGHPYRFLR